VVQVVQKIIDDDYCWLDGMKPYPQSDWRLQVLPSHMITKIVENMDSYSFEPLLFLTFR
jgi:hypothetical protein